MFLIYLSVVTPSNSGWVGYLARPKVHAIERILVDVFRVARRVPISVAAYTATVPQEMINASAITSAVHGHIKRWPGVRARYGKSCPPRFSLSRTLPVSIDFHQHVVYFHQQVITLGPSTRGDFGHWFDKLVFQSQLPLVKRFWRS